MTQIPGESTDRGQVLAGTIVGRFIYTSEGSAGWRVSSSIGGLLAEVQQEAIRHSQRLTSPQGFGLPDPSQRNRRLGWLGQPHSQWRFLMNSIAAGADASGRPNNCVNDCIVVRRDVNAAGADPASFWSSPDWSTPYGAQEVSTLDLRKVSSGLEPRPSEAVDVAQLVTFLLEGRRSAGYLLGLAALIDIVEQNAGSWWVGTADDVRAVGPILLSSLYHMLPADIGWNVTSEIWHLNDGEVNAAGDEALLRFAGSERLPAGARTLQISDSTTWSPRAPKVCQDCGQRQWAWSDVLTTALHHLASLILKGAPTQEIARLAGQLSSYCQVLREQGVTSEDFVGRFAVDALPAQYSEISSLVGAVVTHDHIRVVDYVSDPAAGTEKLRNEPPSDVTHLMAQWFRSPEGQFGGFAGGPGGQGQFGGFAGGPGGQGQFGGFAGGPGGQGQFGAPEIAAEEPDQSVLNLHLALGDGPEQAFRWLMHWSSLGDPERRVVSADPSVRGAVCGRILRSVAVVAVAHFNAPGRLTLSARDVEFCLDQAATGDWWEPIAAVDLLDHFLQAWTESVAVSAVSELLVTPMHRGGVTFPLGYWMAREALQPRDAELAGHYLGTIARQVFPGADRHVRAALEDLSLHVRRSALALTAGGARV